MCGQSSRCILLFSFSSFMLGIVYEDLSLATLQVPVRLSNLLRDFFSGVPSNGNINTVELP